MFLRLLSVTFLGLTVRLTAAAPAEAEPADLAALRSALIPKREVAADAFLRSLPQADGRGVVIAVFDTGVDPAAAGLAVTSDGRRKLVDILDASGSGDVVTSTRRRSDAEGSLTGLSGRRLTLPESLVNPTGEFRLGLKPAAELFPAAVLKRLADLRAGERAAASSRSQAARGRGPDAAARRAAQARAPEDRTRAERDLLARAEALEALENAKPADETLALHDCLVWHDGEHWRVVVDTDEDGDLRDEKALRPFGVAGEHASFGPVTNVSFGVQVYEGGDVVSIVTVGGNHGTHVAAIASAHFPGEPARDGIAPGARILSIKIGDIRTGGSSYGTSELRAAALAAKHRVDIVNASWGGRSLYQDGRNRNSRTYDLLVERHDILAVLSAGNNGPALGTAGSAGAEANRVLGVGAYLSPEMGRVLYQALARHPGTAQQFTSRGPTKDGDLGVDVMAPGAAFASVSTEGLKGAEMMNGTSMASPSAAGVAALVLSAARQKGIDASPARLRAALILGAQPLPDEDAATRGAGLIHAPRAWERLQALQGVAAFGGFYDLEVDQGTFSSRGRGLQLREVLTEPRRRVSVKVTPAWAESVAPEARVAFAADLRLKPSAPWIQAPDYVHLSNGARTFGLVVAAPPVPEGALGSFHAETVDAVLADKPELGPVFSVPVTIIQPAPASAFRDRKLDTVVPLRPAETRRLFVAAPAGASRLRLTVRHRAADTLSRRFVVQAVGYAAQTHIAAMETDQNLTLDPGAEKTFDLRVKPGVVVEVAATLLFSSVGAAALEVRLEWLGLGLETDPLVLPAGVTWAGLDLLSLADREVKVEAKLERAVHVFLPETTELRKMDERAEHPASPLTPGPVRPSFLRQRFLLDLKEPLSVHVLPAEDYDLGDAVGGGRVTLQAESGEVLFDGMGSGNSAAGRPSVRLPKGKVTAVRDFTAPEVELLRSLTHAPLRLAEPLKASRALPVRANLRERFNGKDATELRLKAGREETVYLQDKSADDLAKHEPRPAHVAGTVVFRDLENRELGRRDLVYIPGLSPAKVTNQKAKPKPVPDARTEAEKLADALYEARLAFVRDQRATKGAEVQRQRGELLAAFRTERPEDPVPAWEEALDAAQAAGWASEFWGKARPRAEAPAAGEAPTDTAAVPVEAPGKAVLALLDEVVRRADADAVARHLGAPPATAELEGAARSKLEREKKRLNAHREVLARAERLRADVFRALGRWDDAWRALAEARRWDPETGDRQTRALEAVLHEGAGHLGLALEALNARLKDAPGDRKLREQRAVLYEKLGWTEEAARERLRLALHQHQKTSLDERF